MRLKLVLAYDGSVYSGWQLQLTANPPPTIQGAVETALFTLLQQPVRVHGASRTDAGVHALSQIAHCDVPERNWDWRLRLNSVLPEDIRVISASAADDAFHSRKDAISKTYIYRLWQETGYVPPALRKYVWQCGRLDLDRIHSGLNMLSGTHDFASFQNSGAKLKSTVRTIEKICLLSAPESVWLPHYLPMQTLVISGDGFLKQMVRNITGLIVAIGKGRLVWQVLPEIFASKSRAALPTPTVPARGLFLAAVNYGKDGR